MNDKTGPTAAWICAALAALASLVTAACAAQSVRAPMPAAFVKPAHTSLLLP